MYIYFFKIKGKKGSEVSEMLINGFQEIHKEVCNKPLCPTKDSENHLKKFSRLVVNISSSMPYKYLAIIKFIHHTFQDGLQKYFFKKNFP